MIEITDLTVRFGGVKPLDAMSVTFDAGTCGLIGPNCAGKTTFFNLITGFDRPTSAGKGAHWSFDGRTLDKTSASSVAKAGMVRTFQLTKALSAMTVIENMMLGAQDQAGENLMKSMFRGTWRRQEREIEAKADELLARFKLHEKKHDYAGSLSCGQRKLLEFATVLMGIAGAFIGTGLLAYFWDGYRITPLSPGGFLVAVAGAFLLLLFHRLLGGYLFRSPPGRRSRREEGLLDT